MDPFDGLTDNQIRTAVRNAGGTREALFVPEGAFELLARSQITRLERPVGPLLLDCFLAFFQEIINVSTG
jgi:dynamin 1-like protein